MRIVSLELMIHAKMTQRILFMIIETKLKPTAIPSKSLSERKLSTAHPTALKIPASNMPMQPMIPIKIAPFFA